MLRKATRTNCDAPRINKQWENIYRFALNIYNNFSACCSNILEKKFMETAARAYSYGSNEIWKHARPFRHNRLLYQAWKFDESDANNFIKSYPTRPGINKVCRRTTFSMRIIRLSRIKTSNFLRIVFQFRIHYRVLSFAWSLPCRVSRVIRTAIGF